MWSHSTFLMLLIVSSIILMLLLHVVPINTDGINDTRPTNLGRPSPKQPRLPSSSLKATFVGNVLKGSTPTHAVVESLQTTECRKVQETDDTFVSSGSVYNPLTRDPATQFGESVLLLSHGMVQSFNVETHSRKKLIALNRARFRGMFLSDHGTYVFLITPDLHMPSRFLEINKDSNTLRDVEARGTRDGHDMVRYGELVYVVSTGTGSLQVYNAATLEFVRSHQVCDRKDHINTVAVSSTSLHIMLHKKNVAPSEIRVHYRFSPTLFRTYKNIGNSAHGLSHWNEYIVSLDSVGSARKGSVVLVHRTTGVVTKVWTCTAECFLKGVAVIGDQVLFGSSPPQQRLKRLSVNSSVVSITLVSGQPPQATMNYQQQIQTSGLLNQIIHPKHLDRQHYELLKISAKNNHKAKNKHNYKSGPSPLFAMLGPVDITNMRNFVLDNWDYVWNAFDFTPIFRNRNSDLFLNVRHSRVLFSFRPNSFTDGNGRMVWPFMGKMYPDTAVEMPTSWTFYRKTIIPILDTLFTRLNIQNWEKNILRVQLNHIPANGQVKPHTDVGFYAKHAHRIHIPLIVSKCIIFKQFSNSTWCEVPFKEGETFEINNMRRHTVQQFGPYDRVTMIIDYLDRPCSSYAQLDSTLKKGTISKSLDVQKWRGDL
jgi:hypothetical protein